MKKLIIIKYFLFFVLSTNLIAQTGPGGVGSTDGSSSLKLWLRADANINYSSLDSITSWDDYSGNSNNVSNSTTKPLFSGNTLNSLPVVNFSADAAGLEKTGVTGSALFTANTNTIYVVKKSTSGTTWFNWESAASNQVGFDLSSGNQIYNSPNNVAGALTGANTITGGYHFLSAIVDGTNQTIYFDGDQDATQANALSLTIGSSAGLYIGTADGTGTGGWTGYIAEIIIFNTNLNSAENNIVENALSAKYDIAFATGSNDLYDGDDNGNGDYDYGVVGIGQESDGDQTTAQSHGIIIYEDNTSLADGEYVILGHSNLVDSASTQDVTGGVEQRWNENWYIKKTGSVDIKISFDFSEGINGNPPTAATDYVLLSRAGTTGDFAVVTTASKGIENTDQVYFTVADADLTDGYCYTIGSNDKNNSPVTGGNTWYTYMDGDWDTYTTWTTDPDGSLLLNSNQSIPGASDSIVILNGLLVTISGNTKACDYIDIKSGGIVDIGTTSGHDFGSIYGEGRIRLESDNFPDGDTTDFITKGSVEYKGAGSSYDISAQPAYYDLVINLDAAGNTVVMKDSITVNNDFTITTGEFQINDATDDEIYTLTVTGDIDIESNASLTVGTGDPNNTTAYKLIGNTSTLPSTMGDYHKIFHQIYAYGDITNNGTMQLTNQTEPDYDSLTTTGAVSLYMMNASDNTMNLYNEANLYNLIIDKGTDRTYTLTIYSSDNTYFNLYGPNTATRFTDYFTAPFSAGDFEQRKALWVYHGTLKLTGNIFIPSLVERGSSNRTFDPAEADDALLSSFCLGSSASIWIAGDNVLLQTTAITGDVTATSIHDGTANQDIVISGQLKISAGTFSTRNSGGIKYSSDYSAELIISGGTITISQLRDAANLGDGKFSYIQSGGELIIRGNVAVGSEATGALLDTYAMFDISQDESVFQMSGGEIHFYDNNTYTSDFYLTVAEGNYSVTGGTITIELNGGETFDIYSTPSFYDLDIISADGTGTFTVVLDSGLTVSNDLLVDDNTIFDIDDGTYSLNIGGDLTLGSTTASTANITAEGVATTITFNGAQNSAISLLNNTTDGFFDPYNLIINKDNSSNIVSINSANRADNDIATYVYNDLTITKGILDYSNLNIQVEGDISNSGTCGTDTSTGVLIIANGPARTITTAASGSPTYGHIELDDADGATIVNNTQFKQFTMDEGILYIGDYRLIIDTNEIFFQDGTATAAKMIELSGNHSARGLRLTIDADYTAGKTLLYPVGTNSNYTYAEVVIPAGSGTLTGYYNVAPVNAKQPSYKTGGCTTLDYYWKAFASSDLEGTAAGVDYNFYWTFDSYADGKIYYLDDVDWNSPKNNDGSPLDFQNLGFITSDFTAGKNGCYNNVELYYSDCAADPCAWGDAGSWTGGADFPIYMDKVYINDGDTITVNGNEAANLTIYNGGVMDVSNSTGNTFDRIIGGGKIMIDYNSGEIPAGDFDEFLNNDTATWEYYGNTPYTLPATILAYPNLIINTGDGTSEKTFPNADIIVQKNLYIDGETAILDVDNNIEVYDSIIFDNAGVLTFPNSGTNILTVNKSLDLSGSAAANAIDINTGGAAGSPHTINVYDDIVMNNNASIDLYNGADKEADLYFLGDSNSTISSSSGTIALNDLYINKDLVTDTVKISSNFSLTDNTSLALNLNTGTLIFDNSNIDITITSGDGDFDIPSDGELILTDGTARITGTTTGIALNGKLKLENGSQLLLTDGTNDNYIEYSSSGNSEITITDDAILTVGSQIRRNLVTTSGMLDYTQSGGTVTVGNNSAPETSRGVFEILNTGSSFTFTGGDLIISQSAVATSPAIYLDPETSSVSSGSYITIGDVTTPDDDVIGMYINVDVKNIKTTANGTGNFDVKVFTVPLSLDTLDIAAVTTFDANGISVNISGDFINAGTYNGNSNVTTFNGTRQNINASGTTNFYDLTISNTSDTVFVKNNDITIVNDLTISSGSILADDENTINLEGDVTNNGEHYSKSSTGKIIFNGAERQELTGTGTYGELELINGEGIGLNNNFSLLNNTLTLTSGSIYLRQYQFTLGTGSSVSGTFSENSMLVTNGAISDLGVKRILASGTTNNIIIPIGTAGKYTPVNIDITVNAVSSINIVPVSQDHWTATDEDNVLQYYWKFSNTGFTTVSADITLNYAQEDVSVTGSNNESDYIPAYLEDDAWAKFDQGNVNATNNTISFNVSSASTLEGDYTAGIESAIPDNVPKYISRQDGDWATASTWKIDGGDDPALSVPNGHIVQVEHDVVVSTHLKTAYKTIIVAGGELDIGTTIGHYFGAVSGSGHLKLGFGKLPAGTYASFFACDGGSIEFGGSTNYTIPDEGSTYRRLVLSGTGDRIFPDVDITVCDTLLISGADLDNSTFNNNVTISGLLELSSGSINAGTGTFTFNGSTQQSLGGFTGTDGFSNVTVNNTNGIDMTGDIDISGTLTLTDGIITTNANTLTLENTGSVTAPDSGSATSYIDGPVSVDLDNGNSFEFPVGDDRWGHLELQSVSQTGTQTWTVEYVNATHANQIAGGSLNNVSSQEYWKVTGPTATAKVKIRWNSQSDINGASASAVSNIRSAQYDGSTQWDEIGTSPVGTDYLGIVVSDATVSFTSTTTEEFTLASTAALLASVNFGSTDITVCPGISSNIIVNLTGSADWSYRYTIDGGANNDVTGVTSSPDTIVTSTAGVYLLTAVEESGGGLPGTGIADATTVTISNYTAPTSTATADDATVCGGANSIVHAGAASGTTPYTYTWSADDAGSINNVADPVVAPTLNPTTYSVTVTDDNSCTATDNIAIAMGTAPTPAISATPTEICYGSGDIQFNSVAGMTTYSWSPVDSLSDAAIQNPTHTPGGNLSSASKVTQYSITVTNADGCSASESVDVTIRKLPVTGNIFPFPN